MKLFKITSQRVLRNGKQLGAKKDYYRAAESIEQLKGNSKLFTDCEYANTVAKPVGELENNLGCLTIEDNDY